MNEIQYDQLWIGMMMVLEKYLTRRIEKMVCYACIQLSFFFSPVNGLLIGYMILIIMTIFHTKGFIVNVEKCVRPFLYADINARPREVLMFVLMVSIDWMELVWREMSSFNNNFQSKQTNEIRLNWGDKVTKLSIPWINKN